MKKILCVFLVCVCTLSLFSCGSATSNDKFYDENDPIKVVDCLGRQISFHEPVNTIATSQGGAVDNYFHALKVSDRIIATNGHHSVDKLFFDPSDMPSVGKWSVDKEALAKIKPDLYIGGVNIDDLKSANKMGIKAYGMSYSSFEDITYNLETLGVLFGVQERAQYVIDYLNAILELVDSRIMTVPESERPTAIMLSTVPGEISSKVDTMAEIMMRRAGCVSVVPEKYTKMPDKANVGLEQIFKWNPDVIFFQDLDCELNSALLYEDKTWENTNAVKDKKVFDIPSSLDSWTKSDPACYLGILYMSKQLYPSLFEDIDMEQYAIDFYYEVYGLTLTSDEIGLYIK